MRLLGTQILVNPDNSDEQTTKTGIIIPSTAKRANSNLKKGTVMAKGPGTPWNRMENIHVKKEIMWRAGAGLKHEEVRDGFTAHLLILNYEDILFE